jgi:hypothetical protein
MGTIHRAPRMAQLHLLDDSQREHAIHLAHRALVSSKDRNAKFAAWKVMARLIKSRSQQAVERLKHQRGLSVPSTGKSP